MNHLNVNFINMILVKVQQIFLARYLLVQKMSISAKNDADTTFFIFVWVHKGMRNLCLQFNCFLWSNGSSTVWGANSLRKPRANFGRQRMSFTKPKHSIKTSSNFHMENKNYSSWPGMRLFLLTKWIPYLLRNVENTPQEKN